MPWCEVAFLVCPVLLDYFFRKMKISSGRFFSMSVVMAVCPGAFSLAFYCFLCYFLAGWGVSKYMVELVLEEFVDFV